MNRRNRKPKEVKPLESSAEAENLMQERYCNHVEEAIGMAAEAVIQAIRQEIPDASGKGNGFSLFVP
jgi:hypothetical protein